MFQAPTSLRPNGVLIQNPSRETGAPNTVTHIAPVTMFACQFVDASGTVHEDLVLKMGNKLYLSKNGEQWFKDLREVAPRFQKQAEAKLAELTTSVPKADTVDVFATDQGTRTP